MCEVVSARDHISDELNFSWHMMRLEQVQERWYTLASELKHGGLSANSWRRTTLVACQGMSLDFSVPSQEPGQAVISAIV